ncbi:MAG: efflux RND transporter periplasmic adaptor subunit, partial [Dehalococcoidales bacterium]|nr:efflux RND transporter periplasmic adaptor subunit [Dehalococcoidales bacterium]
GELTQESPRRHRNVPWRRALIGILLVLVVAVAWWTYENTQPVADYLVASGTIEAEEVSLAGEVGGQISQFAVEEGQTVAAGQVLATIDTALLEAQIGQTQAGVDLARANAALVEAGARGEEVRQLEAAVAQATAARDGAKKGWENAQAVLADPLELEAKIDVARPQVAAAQASLERLQAGATEPEKAAAQAAVTMAQAKLDQAKKGATPEQIAIAERQLQIAKNQEYLTQQQTEEYSRRVYGAPPGTPSTIVWSKGMGDAQLGIGYEQTKLAEAQLQRLEEGPTAADLKVAETQVAAAQANLDSLLAIRANPQSLAAQVDAAWAQYQGAEAALSGAQARLDAARNGATAEQLAVAKAQVRQAEAALGVLEAQLAKFTVKAPMAGVVIDRLASAGESVVPGGRLLTMANLDEVDLVVYVPETQIGHIRLGQEVAINVDSFPGRTFTGTVTHIADQAEYTPRNVQSQRERANTVFAVKVSLPNAEHTLKPGMPADATLRW